VKVDSLPSVEGHVFNPYMKKFVPRALQHIGPGRIACHGCDISSDFRVVKCANSQTFCRKGEVIDGLGGCVRFSLDIPNVCGFAGHKSGFDSPGLQPYFTPVAGSLGSFDMLTASLHLLIFKTYRIAGRLLKLFIIGLSCAMVLQSLLAWWLYLQVVWVLIIGNVLVMSKFSIGIMSMKF